MSVPKDLRYTKTHEWIRREGDVAVLGITHYAQDQLGEVVYVELPDAGTRAAPGEELGTLESVKAVSELFSPVGGEVIAVNERLTDAPHLVNDDPFGEGWLVKIKISEEPELLDAAAYEKLVAEESQ
ncbi:MAG: glycine cleavage system protein GcvH [Acidobacteria bacterium]|nr:glycine cleavage system protein GcvH [Acidobacteriota bacterium]